MRISIRSRIYGSFFILVLLFVVNAAITIVTINHNKMLSGHLSGVVDPSIQSLEDLKKMMIESKMYTTNWVFLRYNEEDKQFLRMIHDSSYAALKSRLDFYAAQWNNRPWSDSLHRIYTGFGQLLVIENGIMHSLKVFEDYDDPVAKLQAEDAVESQVLPRTARLMNQLMLLTDLIQKAKLVEDNNLAKSSVLLRMLIIILAVTITCAGFFFSVYMTRIIIRPITRIRHIINDLGQGIIKKTHSSETTDEIGAMIRSVNNLSNKLDTTAQFAYAVGSRNFKMPYQPLSQGDMLGKALLAMRDGLLKSETELVDITDDLKKKDELLMAVGSAIHELISNHNLEQALGKAIRLLGLKMQVDKVNVYRNATDEGDDLIYSNQLVRWVNAGDQIEYNHPQFQRLSGWPFAMEVLQKGGIFFGLTANLEDALLKALFEKECIKSMATIPIFVLDQFWGFVGFHDCRHERQWTQTEFSILTSFSVTLGSCIERVQIEQQMIIARDRAEAASVAKSEFMANMSHELRTPMNGIIGFTDLVMTTGLQNTQREYLQNVSKSAYNLLNIINDILDFSKIEAGKLAIDMSGFKLAETMEETVDLLSIRAFEKGLEIICDIDPLIPSRFRGDPLRIKQILVNLIGNAIKFTHKGEVRVSARMPAPSYLIGERRYQDINIAVGDTGIGISAADLNKIFESFTQADSSTTRQYGGTGLGLTISRLLAQLMGGSLTALSGQGNGSVFTLALSLEILDELPRIKAAPKGKLRSVLVIDDNLSNRRLLEGIFEYLHITCRSCSSGAEALRIITGTPAQQGTYDLIITDHQMPGMDGIELVKEIRRLSSGPSEPFILMLSSLEKTMIRQEAEKAGIDKFLSKPVKLNDLVSLLSSLFEGPGAVDFHRIQQHRIGKFSRTARVLVAEDEPMNMLLISELLGNMGLEVIKAGNGEEVLSLLVEKNPEIIFMDINMPVMDGYVSTEKIRKMAAPYASIPIIALTADAMKEDRDRCLRTGMDDFISKPFRLQQIEMILKKFLKTPFIHN